MLYILLALLYGYDWLKISKISIVYTSNMGSPWLSYLQLPPQPHSVILDPAHCGATVTFLAGSF